MADEKVEPSVAVVVDKRGRHAPAVVICPALLRDVRERAVAVAAIQLIATEIRDVQVDTAVVVEVTCCHTHAISARVDPACDRDVGESKRTRAVRVDLEVTKARRW